MCTGCLQKEYPDRVSSIFSIYIILNLDTFSLQQQQLDR